MSSTTSYVLFSRYAPANENGIQAYALDKKTGSLTHAVGFAGILNPSFILPHPNGKWLYAVSETSKQKHGMFGSVYALNIAHKDSINLHIINNQSANGDETCHLQLDQTGRWLFASNYGTGNAAVFLIKDDGSIGEMTSLVQHEGNGPHKDQQGPHAHSSILSPDNRFAIIADLGSDQLVVYQFDANHGKLTLAKNVKTKPGTGPRHTVFHPNAKAFYAANELNSTVSAYNYDASTGGLMELQTLTSIPAGKFENIGADIHLSKDAKFLYASNRGHNSVAVYPVDANGKLSDAKFYNCGGNVPRNFALSPDENFILVANKNSNQVNVMSLNKTTGEIGAPVAHASVQQASCVQFMESHE